MLKYNVPYFIHNEIKTISQIWPLPQSASFTRVGSHITRWIVIQINQNINVTSFFHLPHHSLQIDFKLPLSAWFSKLVMGRTAYNSSGYVNNFCKNTISTLSISTTGTSEFLECYGACEDDERCMENCCSWIWMFPCCLLTCPCYRVSHIPIYRQTTKKFYQWDIYEVPNLEQVLTICRPHFIIKRVEQSGICWIWRSPFTKGLCPDSDVTSSKGRRRQKESLVCWWKT